MRPSLFLSWSLALCVSSSAFAEEGPLTVDESLSVTQAQAHFARGLELSRAERWVEARDAFRRSAALKPRASTYFNLAVACLELGLGRAALDALDAFETLAEPAAHDEQRAIAPRLRSRAQKLVGRVVLSLVPAQARVQVDGSAVPGEGAERIVLLDPGMHVLQIEAEGFRSERLELSVELDRTVRRHVELVALEPEPRAAAQVSSLALVHTTHHESGSRTAALTRAQDEPVRDDPGLFRSPLFWIVAGTVVASAITAAVLLSSASSSLPEPYPGNFDKAF